MSGLSHHIDHRRQKPRLQPRQACPKRRSVPDPTGWLMFENLNGVRTFFDGKDMYSRPGNPFTPPKWFLDKFPENVTLDGAENCWEDVGSFSLRCQLSRQSTLLIGKELPSR
ncbi:uncharacterized protein BT62DRAFT_919006 [Guyanagaster necrorhizus]|uniref:Uncharacterized protein n=1 Tax=Guyanagaster necrorhizus TaxID=856835 RepID=A0A9P8ATU4_9AGAR|nr:uncharacterized protein BT62DRAFT_919006 [Guyanagaster necrorhizus MCA 3950]KAG7447798.1 hypothetical protein BT62DRAFT_919006 [Guyanagaster necrorhizus MCA 3950]